MTALQAFADAFKWNVQVYFKSGSLMTIVSEAWQGTLSLQCCGGVHFNCFAPNRTSPREISKVENQQGDSISGRNVERVVAIPNHSRQIRAAYCDSIPYLTITHDKTLLLEHQKRDKLLRKLVELKFDRNLQLFPDEKRDMAQHLVQLKTIFVKDVLLCKQVIVANEVLFVSLIPTDQLQGVCQAYHEHLSHTGRDKVISVIRTKLFHPRLSSAMADSVRECMVCQCHKDSTIHCTSVTYLQRICR